MAAVTVCSDFGAWENKICYCATFPPSICHEVMQPNTTILVFSMLSFKPAFPLSSFTLIKRLFSSSSLSAIKVVSSAYLRLLIFLLAILIPACDSSSLAFHMMYLQCDNIKPCHTPFSTLNQSVVSYLVLSVASWPSYRFLRREVRWSGMPMNFPQFIVIHTVKSFHIVNEAEVDVFLELLCFLHDLLNVGNLTFWSLSYLAIFGRFIYVFIYSLMFSFMPKLSQAGAESGELTPRWPGQCWPPSPATCDSQKRTLGQALGLSWDVHTHAFLKHFGSCGISRSDTYWRTIGVCVTVLVSYCGSFLGLPQQSTTH